MKRERATIEAELAALRAADFDEGDSSADGMERLYRLCDELHAAFAPGEAAPLLLAFAERLEDAHLGMANRIANARGPDREEWVQLIEAVARDPGVPREVREDARQFAERQRASWYDPERAVDRVLDHHEALLRHVEP